MAGSMKDIKLRIKSVESTMQITKAMELVASSKMRRAKERVEHSRPYFETLYESLTKIAAADPRARNPYLRRDGIKRTLLVVIAGDRGLAGGYNANVFKQADAAEGPVTVLPIGTLRRVFRPPRDRPLHPRGADGGGCVGERVLHPVPPDNGRLPQGRVRRGEALLHPL